MPVAEWRQDGSNHPVECPCTDCTLLRFATRHVHCISCICPECEAKYPNRPIDCDHLQQADEDELQALFNKKAAGA